SGKPICGHPPIADGADGAIVLRVLETVDISPALVVVRHSPKFHGGLNDGPITVSHFFGDGMRDHVIVGEEVGPGGDQRRRTARRADDTRERPVFDWQVGWANLQTTEESIVPLGHVSRHVLSPIIERWVTIIGRDTPVDGISDSATKISSSDFE